MNEFEVEKDYTLIGNQLEMLINATVPGFIIKWVKGDSGNQCGCDKRREWLNDKHLDYREWRITRAQTNYKIAKDKLDRLMKQYYE